MKILWLCFSNLTSVPWTEGLRTVEPDTHVVYYDRLGLPSDRGVLDAADRLRPDLILFTGKAGGPGAIDVPEVSTLKRLRRYAPVVHVGGDFSDPPWWPFLEEYLCQKVFDFTVNFDGNDEWPKGPRDYTTLSPTAPQFFQGAKPLAERPIKFGFAGTYSSPSRRAIIEYLVEHAGLVVKPWDGTYQDFANFLMNCQVVVNVPFSGSDAVRQVKGRVVEAGLAGCILLEHVEAPTKGWLLPGVHYLEYNTPERAAELGLGAPYLYGAGFLGPQLHERISTAFSPTVFWNRLFDAVKA